MANDFSRRGVAAWGSDTGGDSYSAPGCFSTRGAVGATEIRSLGEAAVTHT
jgi:hypothetical protein